MRLPFLNTWTARLLGAVAGLCCGLVARGELEWRGTLVERDQAKFALTDTASGNSKWVPVGGSFLSYSVEDYDAGRQVLTLSHAGQRLELKLANPTPAAVQAVPPKDELEGLFGMPLAEALANQGNETLKDMLARHREVVLHREELVRKIAGLDRASPGSDAVAEARRQAELAALKTEAQQTDSAEAEMTAKITEFADRTRKSSTGPSGKQGDRAAVTH